MSDRNGRILVLNGVELMKTATTQAIEVLQQNNYKLTKQRRSLINFLAQHQERYVEITKIDQYLRQLYPGMSHNTIYRNLKEFEEIGIVETHVQNDQMQVKYQCDYANQHHHHFVCQNCGRVTEIQMCPIDMDFFQQQLPGAQITGHRFELVGLCADCSAAAREKK